MTNPQTDLCPLCGGNKAPGKITFTADLGTGLVVVRRVSATVCMQCGEEWIDDATAPVSSSSARSVGWPLPFASVTEANLTGSGVKLARMA
ncbi:MAG: type II toxin-antitoxin system MqsA family antitoxin [Verrucomicrobiales bacterium]